MLRGYRARSSRSALATTMTDGAGVGEHRHPQRRDAGDGQHQERRLQQQRDGDVGPDVAQRRARKADRIGQLQQLVGHQRHVGGLERRRPTPRRPSPRRRPRPPARARH